MTTPEVQAAVERVTALAGKPHTTPVRASVLVCQEDLRTILHALNEAKSSLDEHALFDAETDLAFKDLDAEIANLKAEVAEANERASLLQTAVHERCAERDEARNDIELLKDEVVAAIREHGDTLTRAEAAEAECTRLRDGALELPSVDDLVGLPIPPSGPPFTRPITAEMASVILEVIAGFQTVLPAPSPSPLVEGGR